MSDAVVRAAKVIADFTACGHCEGTCGTCRGEAEALDAAGLLTKYPRLAIEGEWLIEVVDYHTCGAGPGSGAGHEPGCGSIPVAGLVTTERDAAVAAKALREAADSIRAGADVQNKHTIGNWLRARADRIEREAGESDAER